MVTDARYPEFGPAAVAAGMAAVFTFPVRHEEERFGALDLERDTPGELDAGDMAAAQTLADVVSAYGARVLERSCREWTQWRAGHPDLPLDLSVNISARQLTHAECRDRWRPVQGADDKVSCLGADRRTGAEAPGR